MRPLLNLLAAVVAVAILGLAVGALLVPVRVDAGRYARQLAAEVEARSGHSLEVRGEARLVLWPWPGLVLGDVRLDDAPGFGGGTLARCRELRVRARLLPLLLGGRIEARAVRLRGLEVELARDARGRGNWQGLAGGGVPGAALAGLAAGALEVRGAAIEWRDARSGRVLQLSDLRLRSEALAPGRPAEVHAAFALQAPDGALRGEVSAGAIVTLSPARGTWQADSVSLDARLQGGRLPAEGLALELKGGLRGDLDGGRVALRDLRLHAGALELHGNLELSGLGSEPRYAGELTTAEVDLRRLLERFGAPRPHTADPDTLRAVQGAARFEGGADLLRLEALSLQVDETEVTGSARILDFASPSLHLELVFDELDADRYLPGRGGEAAGTTLAALRSALGGLEAQGRLRFGRLTLGRVSARSVDVGLAAEQGRVELDPLSADLYGGSTSGHLELAAAATPPRLRLEQKLSGVRAGPLVEDLTGTPALRGRGDLDARLELQGAGSAQWLRSLGGELDFDLADGALGGVDIPWRIRAAQARREGREPPAAPEPAETGFRELRGSVQIEDGVARNEDLVGKSPLLRLSGRGEADLARDRIDYLLHVTLVGTTKAQGGADLTQVMGRPIPLRVSGALSDPHYELRLERAAPPPQETHN